MNDDAHRLAREQPAQATSSIGADVRRKAVTQRIRQVVDQGCIAKMVFAAPIMAVSLKGILALRADDHDFPAGPGYPYHFRCGCPVILHMFDHFVGEYQIEVI